MTEVAESAGSSLFSWILFGSKVLGGIVASILLMLYVNQDRLLYMPNPPGFPKTPSENPAGMNKPSDWTKSGKLRTSRLPEEEAIPYEEAFIATEDGQSIHTWLMLQDNSEEVPTLIYFHGNAGNMGFRLMNASLMFAQVKINILMMDYRGYGTIDKWLDS